MSEFEFPTNIKQIGSIGQDIKIYVEDYVCSYLHQYAESGGYDERIAFLVGRHMVIDNSQVLFISGAIQSRDVIFVNGITKFSKRSFDYGNEQIRKYFEGLEIVGWMQSQPGYGTFLNPSYCEYHFETFKKPYQVMFVVDSIEKISSFYYYNEECDDLIESKGYFVYYEKNMNMHEYMLQNKVVKLKVQDKADLKKVDFDKESDRESDYEESENSKKPKELDILEMPQVPRLQRQAESRHRTSTREQVPVSLRSKQKDSSSKRIVNMLTSLSAVLILVCIVMGAGLVQNEGRITSLEDQISNLANLYKNATVQSTKEASVFLHEDEETGSENTLPQADSAPQISDGAALANENTEAEAAQGEKPADIQQMLIQENGTELAQNNPSETDNKSENESSALPQSSEPPQDTASEVVETAASSIPKTYTVQQGDNLSYISMKFYGNKSMVNKIMEENGLTNPDTIYFGKVIKLPRP